MCMGACVHTGSHVHMLQEEQCWCWESFLIALPYSLSQGFLDKLRACSLSQFALGISLSSLSSPGTTSQTPCQPHIYKHSGYPNPSLHTCVAGMVTAEPSSRSQSFHFALESLDYYRVFFAFYEHISKSLSSTVTPQISISNFIYRIISRTSFIRTLVCVHVCTRAYTWHCQFWGQGTLEMIFSFCRVGCGVGEEVFRQNWGQCSLTSEPCYWSDNAFLWRLGVFLYFFFRHTLNVLNLKCHAFVSM